MNYFANKISDTREKNFFLLMFPLLMFCEEISLGAFPRWISDPSAAQLRGFLGFFLLLLARQTARKPLEIPSTLKQ
jgi:hypothetical protein